MGIPLRVFSPEADKVKREGDGWRLMTDEERNINASTRPDDINGSLDIREE
jgi:hypothetical protein